MLYNIIVIYKNKFKEYFIENIDNRSKLLLKELTNKRRNLRQEL
jgi:hypothetical protein